VCCIARHDPAIDYIEKAHALVLVPASSVVLLDENAKASVIIKQFAQTPTSTYTAQDFDF
jgi:hypothetical protein